MRHQIRGRRRRSRPCCDAAITVDGQILGSMPSDTSREALAKPSLLTVEIMKSSLNTTKKSTTARRSSPTPPWLLLGLFRNRRCFEYRKERSHRGLREDVKGIFRSVSSQNVVWGLSVDGLKECHRDLFIIMETYLVPDAIQIVLPIREIFSQGLYRILCLLRQLAVARFCDSSVPARSHKLLCLEKAVA